MRAIAWGWGFLVTGAACSAACGDESQRATVAESDAGHAPVPDANADDGAAGPARLSETGLYADIQTRTIAPGIFTYAPRYEFWVDGAKKTRWLYLPPGTKIDTSAIDDFRFPVGTKAWKEFTVDGKVVETRLLSKVREGDDGWWEAAYVWTDDGTDAIAQLDGVPNASGTSHDVPSQSDCQNCHGSVKDVLIGVSAIQLGDSGEMPRPIDVFAARGWLTTPPPANLDVPGTGAVKDGLAYLHANCGHCHNDGAVRLSTQTKMRLRLLVGKTVAEAGALTTTVGTVMKHPLPNDVTNVVVAGAPDESGLYVRMGLTDAYRMPPAGTKTVDVAGRNAVRDLILGMK